MSSPNADLIAVSLACPKDPTSPYRIGPPRESSVRNLLEKVGNLRDIAVLVQLNSAFLTFTDLHLHSQIVSDDQPLFLNGIFEVNFFLDVMARSLILKELHFFSQFLGRQFLTIFQIGGHRRCCETLKNRQKWPKIENYTC